MHQWQQSGNTFFCSSFRTLLRVFLFQYKLITFVKGFYL